MAPEMLNNKGYSYQVDWWALGTIMYEMLTGLAPFLAEDQDTMFKNIQKQKLPKPKTEVPLSKDCLDLLDKLLHKDPTKRLGNNGSLEILNHPFFKGLDLQSLKQQILDAPFKPFVTDDPFDIRNFEQDFTSRTSFEDGRYSTNKAELIKTRSSMFKRL